MNVISIWLLRKLKKNPKNTLDKDAKIPLIKNAQAFTKKTYVIGQRSLCLVAEKIKVRRTQKTNDIERSA